MRNEDSPCKTRNYSKQSILYILTLVAGLLPTAFVIERDHGLGFYHGSYTLASSPLDSNNQVELTPISPQAGVDPLTPTPEFGVPEQTQSSETVSSTSWQQQSPPSSPSSRAEMGFVYDSYRRVIVAIGGSQGSTEYAETWEYSGNTWTNKLTAHFPGARNRPAIAYDPDRRVSILFGGSTPGDTRFFNDTWEYDGIDWKQKQLQNPPSPRNGATMVYDPVRRKMLLFGGYRYQNGFVFFNETWEYDGIQWSQLSPANRPAERETAAMVYDSHRNRVILFGGGRAAGSTVFGDTWVWNGANWTQISPPSSPPARWAHAMTYDQGRQQIVLFGGLTGTTKAFNDTWEFDGSANTWRQITVSPTPPQRWDHGLTYDSNRNKIVLFGGMYYAGAFQWRSDTWHYEGSQATAKRPVVLLPGFPGSILHGSVKNDPNCTGIQEMELWANLGVLVDSLDDSHLKRLQLRADGINPANPCNIVTAPQIIGMLPFIVWELHFYDDLIRILTESGYSVFPCPFDWRRSLESEGERPGPILAELDECVRLAQRGNPNQQVDIIAHSTGGLVARRFVLSNPNRAAKVNTIVSLGTPYLGTVVPFVLLRYGDTLIGPLDLVLTNERIIEAAPNWPAIYQLLPSHSSFDVLKGYFKKRELGKPSYADYSIYPLMRQFLSDNYTGDLVTLAHTFHSGAMDDWRNDGLAVNYYVFAGEKIGTPRWIREWYDARRGVQQSSLLRHAVVYTATGDGTVPLESARLLGGTRAGDAKICTYKVKHEDLPKNDTVIKAIQAALTGQDPCPNSNQVTAAAAVSSEQEELPQLAINGAGLVHVWDNQDRHTGPVSNTLLIEENIPFVTYMAGEAATFVTLPPISTYTVTVTMSDTLPMEFKLLTAIDAETLEEAISQTVIFQDVPAVVGGQATLFYHPLAAPENLRLMLDLNGDHVYELELAPTAVLNQQESADYESPITNIHVQGNKDEAGFFTGLVTVTLAADDTGSGLYRIEYSVDKGVTLLNYTRPFSVVAEQVSAILARAIDRAGNAEYPFANVTLRPANNFLGIPQSEYDALVALYNSTNGDQWTINASWLTGALPCSWYGVTCSNGHVTELNLSLNRLNGELPVQIGNLTELQRLVLFQNQIYGVLPSSLGNLTQLTLLSLANNQLGGTLPANLGGMKSLQRLHLQENRLEGSIPAELGNLANLLELDLTNNQLNGPLPSSLTNLTRLTVFLFAGNSLCEPPDADFQRWLAGIPLISRQARCVQAGTPIPTATSTPIAVSTPTPRVTPPAVGSDRVFLPLLSQESRVCGQFARFSQGIDRYPGFRVSSTNKLWFFDEVSLGAMPTEGSYAIIHNPQFMADDFAPEIKWLVGASHIENVQGCNR